MSVSYYGVTSRTSESCSISADGNVSSKDFTENAESIENELHDVKRAKGTFQQTIDIRLLESGNTESLKNSKRSNSSKKNSSTDSSCAAALHPAKCGSGDSNKKVQARLNRTSQSGKGKYWFKCITPKPYIAGDTSYVNHRTAPDLKSNARQATAFDANKFSGARRSYNSANPNVCVRSPLISDETSFLHRVPERKTVELSPSLRIGNGPVCVAAVKPATGSDDAVKPVFENSVGVGDRDKASSAERSAEKETVRTTGSRNKIRPVTNEKSLILTQTSDFSKPTERCTSEVSHCSGLNDMGNISPRRSENDNSTKEEIKSKRFTTTPFANSETSVDIEKPYLKSRHHTIPEVVVSDTSMEQDLENMSLQNSETGTFNVDEIDESSNVVNIEKPQLRPLKSSDSAYSSDSRCTSMDSATCAAARAEDGYLADQDTPALLCPPLTFQEWKSAGSSSSSSSSPLHVPVSTASNTSSDQTLRVISDYGNRRKLSSSSGSSFRSSLSFEESEDDMPSSDNELQRKAQSSWTKIRRMVIWSPFMQSFKKKYPWVQLAGHAGNFQPGDEGCILKKYCQREAECLSQLSHDEHLGPYAPDYHGVVEKDGEKYTRMQDLLLAFDCPSVMDCKMGLRTYLEDELVKAKIKPRLRHDMYKKMTEISPDEPTPEEHEQKAVTKPRYMQWREHVSSSSNLGFRIEGIKKGDKEPSKDYKLTKTKEQVKNAFKYFINDKIEVLEKYIKRLKNVRDDAEKSDFFMSHEVIGSSLLFVHDHTNHASLWMIDFGKTTKLSDNKRLTHREQWVEGNREDGYLLGLDNLINIFEEIATELKEQPVGQSKNPTSSTSNNEEPKRSHPTCSWTLSSQSSGESCEPNALDSPTLTISDTSFENNQTPKKRVLKRQIAATSSNEGSTPNGDVITHNDQSDSIQEVVTPEAALEGKT